MFSLQFLISVIPSSLSYRIPLTAKLTNTPLLPANRDFLWFSINVFWLSKGKIPLRWQGCDINTENTTALLNVCFLFRTRCPALRGPRPRAWGGKSGGVTSGWSLCCIPGSPSTCPGQTWVGEFMSAASARLLIAIETWSDMTCLTGLTFRFLEVGRPAEE